MKQRVKAVIFDLDDTLLDWSTQSVDWKTFTKPMVGNIYDHLRDKGYPLPAQDAFFAQVEQDIHKVWEQAKLTWAGAYFGDALQRTFLAFDLPLDEISVDEVLQVYDWRPMPGVVPFPDTIAVLNALRAQGIQLGLITNSFFPMWMRDVELEVYGLIDYFDARITSGDSGFMKPHPAIYQRMLGLLNVAAEQAVFVGDRPENDIVGANEAGLISVLMSPAHLNRDLNGVEPDYIVSTLSELLPVLAQLEAGEREQLENG